LSMSAKDISGIEAIWAAVMVSAGAATAGDAGAGAGSAAAGGVAVSSLSGVRSHAASTAKPGIIKATSRVVLKLIGILRMQWVELCEREAGFIEGNAPLGP
jgi:hypothetical protein